MRVLMIGSAGSLLGCVAARALTGEGATVVRGQGPGDPALPSRHFAGVLTHPDLGDAAAFGEFMLDRARTDPGLVILPLSDAALLALDPVRPELEAAVPVAAPPREAVRAVLDKGRCVEVASGLAGSIRAPATLRPLPGIPVSAQWQGRYPAIVKPVTGTQTEGIRLAATPEELDAAHARTARDYPDPLVQEAVAFRIERKFILYYLFDHEGRMRGWYGQKVLAQRRSMKRGGSEVRVPGGIALHWESWFDENLLERGRRLMEAFGWRGLGFIEGAFDERDGAPYLFEINPRMGGTQALSLKEGVNFVHDACMVAQRRSPPERLGYRTGVRAKRDPFTLVATREPAMIALALDPRPVSSTPAWSDPAPMLVRGARFVSELAGRLVGRSAR